MTRQLPVPCNEHFLHARTEAPMLTWRGNGQQT
jgi:hypothetical protein